MIMKKKLMMVAVLLGALSLGACVDNDESASVEAVRTAKAEQLKSVAAMNNAEAEATKLMAEAKAALKNAEAEAKKIENDFQKGILATRMAKEEAELKQAIAEAEKAMQAALEALKGALQTADDATRTRIGTLATNYNTAVTALNALKITVTGEQNTLIGLQYDLITAQEALAKNIAGYEKTISVNEAQIAAYKEYGTGVGLDGLKAALATSKAAEASLANAEDIAKGKVDVLAAEATTARTAYRTCKYNRLVGAAYSSYITVDLSNNGPYAYAEVNNIVTFETDVLAQEANAKTKLEAVDAPKTDYDAAVAAEAAAKKAWVDAAEGADKATAKTAYDAALSDLNTKKSLLKTAQDASDLAAKNAKTWRDDFTYLTQTGLDAQKKLVDALNVADKAVVDGQKAATEANLAVTAENAKGGALNDLINGANGNPGLDDATLIANCETAIADAKRELALAESIKGNGTPGSLDSPAIREELIAQQQAKIEALNNEIAAKEAIVKSAKAALDAAMAAAQ